MKPVLAEILKLRSSTSWAVVVLLPVASIVSACIFVRQRLNVLSLVDFVVKPF